MSDVHDFLAGGGELGKLMRGLDWSSSPLGAPPDWPQGLRSIVSLLLNSKYPMFLAWGPQLAFLYNDAYRPIFADKHPQALGRPFAEVWSEIWPDIQPLVARALSGEATWLHDMQLFMQRSGYLEETYYTFSYSPVRDDAGAVGGMFCACTETTAQVLGERRQGLLARLADIAGRVRRVDDAWRQSMAVLAEERESLPAIVLLDTGDGRLLLQGCQARDGSLAVTLKGLAEELANDTPCHDVDLARLPLSGGRSAWNDPLRSASLLPVRQRERHLPAALLLLAHNPRRALDTAYRLFLERVAAALSAALVRAQAFEAESARAAVLAMLRREAERQKRLYGTILSSTPDLIYVFDLNYRITYANEALLRTWDRSLEDCLGRSLLELGHEAGHVRQHEREIDRVIASRQPLRGEVSMQHASLGPRIYDYILSPVLDENGQVEAIAGTSRDITEIKQAETALGWRTAQYEALVNAAPLGIFLVDADFRLAAVNPQAQPTFNAVEPLIGRDFAEVLLSIWPRDFAERTIARFRHTLASGDPYLDPELIQQRQDNQATEYFDWSITRIPLPDGGYGVVCYFRDISEQVKARQAIQASEEALREADRRKNEFLATLAHELRNPLAPLQSSLELLRDGSADAPLLTRLRDIMARQTLQLSTLVDDLLDISRITRGKLELRKRAVPLHEVVDFALETSRPHLERAGHRFEQNLPEQPLLLDGDPKRLVQMLSNLLNNAAQYTPTPGRIVLNARPQDGMLRLSVRDSGIGIPADRLHDIFEMFTQIEPPKRGGKGLGIGLTLSRLLVEMHGGRIEVQSDGSGAGSEFTVWLPLAEAGAHPPPQPARLPARGKRPVRVLLVDDNQEAADTLGLLIGMHGHAVEIAGDGVEALEKADAFRPELVLMDLGMPRLDGLEAARRLRERDWAAGVLLVALTGWGQEEDRRRTRLAGFDAHLVKPVEYRAVQALIDGLDMTVAADPGPT